MDKVAIGMIIPFLGTIFGSFFVFFMREKIDIRINKIMLGFASGIMVAASIWSLLIPAIEQSQKFNTLAWFPAVCGLVVGFVFLLFLDFINEKIYNKTNKEKNNIKKKSLLALSITIHNIPEGMAVGVALAAAYYGNALLTFSAALALSIGVAVQNIPEGAIVSMPLKLAGKNKFNSFMCGVFSGIVEPLFAIVTFLITSFVVSILPYILSFAAGCMLFVVVNEIIPEAVENGKVDLVTIGFALGFILMLILDVSLG